MVLHTVVQRACRSPTAPDDQSIREWADAAFRTAAPPAGDLELTVRIVDEDEAAELNFRYRGKDYAPNVLSFPMDPGGQFHTGVLGDVVISLDTAARQAERRGAALADEVRTLLTHGVLHLLGYDHERSHAEARRMFRRQRELVRGLGERDGTKARRRR